ncbi:hypothetical protein GRI62_11740 [Erythrobacter arachoides]|uniref:Uncharacterized protein n=1 Tax=Aurantiacibacter arachoides TaxID=1850444 RepID=A0A845A5Q7_9SPHN|nr:hypothetical protein [Aurantiacibacter arachoides]MXO94267.1 hypothetical protein [Aurantiacibacter arachoides]GGD64834.1 hypothetical protein GCM10011411_26410 [Aurantiacibacter arachoides]
MNDFITHLAKHLGFQPSDAITLHFDLFESFTTFIEDDQVFLVVKLRSEYEVAEEAIREAIEAYGATPIFRKETH